MKMTARTKSVPIRKNYYEALAWGEGRPVCGIDEVGRGAHAGPVVAAAVLLPIGKTSNLLQDSKLLSPAQREKGFEWIKKHCIYGVGIINHRLIEQKNISQATILAMKKALLMAKIHSEPAAILVDAVKIDLSDCKIDIPIHAFPYGEYYSSSIAAASIVAKVTRDRIMEQFSTIFPAYGFASHKGYGTAAHKNALAINGMLIIHRETYVKMDTIDDNSNVLQQPLFQQKTD